MRQPETGLEEHRQWLPLPRKIDARLASPCASTTSIRYLAEDRDASLRILLTLS
jgi:hypothetical protein